MNPVQPRAGLSSNAELVTVGSGERISHAALYRTWGHLKDEFDS
ncbi:hypothetical protein [Streptomyces resistomycificus]|nr:hypothetical protein [Streptomyces resistomycificus]